MRKTRGFLVAAGVSLALAFTLSCSGDDGIDGNHGTDGNHGIDGKDGADGNHGTDGKDGADGNHGTDGKDGADGIDGNHGTDGKDGADGIDGNHGTDGKDGADGIDGKDGTDGKDGADGKNGTNGKDGADGKDGTDGKDADCEVESDDTGAYFVMKCGGVEKARWPKAMCGAVAYDPEVSLCDILEGGLIKPMCGQETYDPEIEKCSKNGVVLSIMCGQNKYDPEGQLVCENDILKFIFIDSRDGKEYKSVVIGTQTWMAENLNYDVEGSKCYDDNPDNCETYGRLYDWSTAMDNSESSDEIPSGVQGICPSGWHLPSDGEWTMLTTAVDPNSAHKLRAASVCGNCTDEYEFSALLGGMYSNGSFSNETSYGYWWAATENGTYGWNRNVSWNNNTRDVNRSIGNKSVLYSVRCVKD